MDVLETAAALTRAVKEAGCGLVCLDDVGPGRLNADAIVNVLETEPAPEALRGREIALHEGPQYAALPEEYAGPGVGEREVPAKVRDIIITLGGADPGALAPKAACAVRRAVENERAGTAFVEPRVLVLTGSASSQALEVAHAVLGAAAFTVKQSVPSLLPELRRADLGVIAGGLTMHEALAVGLPCITLCQPVRHQAELAQRFANDGAMLTLGRGTEATEARICEAVLDLAADADLRGRLAARGPELVDGRGAQRAAQVICAVAARY
jgi:spore coat polysaccharide biosynthesis predicted glycosyltransferase SpsG